MRWCPVARRPSKGSRFPFALSDRTLRVQNAVVQTEAASLNGSARLDLDSGTVEGDVDIALRAGDFAMEGASPNLRLRLTGDVLSPERGLDVTEITNFLSLGPSKRSGAGSKLCSRACSKNRG